MEKQVAVSFSMPAQRVLRINLNNFVFVQAFICACEQRSAFHTGVGGKSRKENPQI